MEKTKMHELKKHLWTVMEHLSDEMMKAKTLKMGQLEVLSEITKLYHRLHKACEDHKEEIIYDEDEKKERSSLPWIK